MTPRSTEAPLPEHIAATIVKRINSGVLKSGDRIIEQAVADEFETSRGPVRDALKILHAKNWVDLLPRQGARVAAQEPAPRLESILIGAAILGLAFRFAVMKASDAEIDEFYERAKRVISLGKDRSSSAEEFSAAAAYAGNFAIAVADNKRIDDIVGPVPQGALSSYAPLSVHTPETKAAAAELWIELALAFKTRDSLAAERVGKSMVESAYKRILTLQLEAHSDPKS